MSEIKKRRRGERPDGLIQVSYTDGRNADGSPRRVYFYGHTRAEAEAKKEDYKQRGKSGIDSKGLSVSDWIDKWISLYDINKDMYQPYISRLRKDIGHMQLAEVREADLVRSLREGYAGRSSSGAVKYRMILMQCFKKARVNRLILYDPAEDLKLPKTAAPEGHRALSRWEIDLILASWQEHRCGLWILLMLLAGLRRGELMALTWDNIDLDACTLSVSQTAVVKGNQTTIEPRAKTLAGIRTVPICAPLKKALEAVPLASRKGFVCLSSKGTKLSETGFSRGFEGFCAAMSRIHAGIEPDQHGRRSDIVGLPPSDFSIRAHDLRHTFCTLLFDSNIDVKTASYLMGHSDTRVTLEIYTHISEERKRKSAAALVGLLDGFST